MNPTVSIIMSTYNSAQYLQGAIESMLAQTYSDFEFLIVDDASTDTTAEILAQYGRKDARIRVVTHAKNLGLTKSLNELIVLSRGTYIARMDADDIAYPERLAMQVVFLDTHAEYGLVGAWAKVIDAQGQEIDTFTWEVDDAAIRKALIAHNHIIHPSAVFRRSVLDQTGLYDEHLRYAQDYDLFFRIIAVAKVYNIPHYLLQYRVSGHSITASKNSAQAWCALRARWNAIRAGTYGPLAVIHLVRPLLGMVLPSQWKGVLKNLYK